MAWDAAEPQDTTKIRNLGVVIRPNWVAIEEADTTFQPKGINFTNRTVSGPTDDPTADATSVIVYSKEDASSNPQLYAIDPSSNITQITGYGSIMAWGRFNGGSGAITSQYNVTSVTRNSAGNYTVAFTNNLSNANYAVVVTGQMNSAFTTGGIVGVGSLAVSGFDIYVKSLTAAVGADLNPISFMVINA